MELKLLTAQSAADALGVSADLIWKAVRNGEIDTLEIPGKHVVFTQEALLAWVQQRLEAGNRVDVPDSDVITCAEMAGAAGLTTQGVTHWIHRGQARGVKVRGKWCMRWDEARRVAREKGFLEQFEALERAKRSVA